MTYTAAPTFDGGRWRDNKKEKKIETRRRRVVDVGGPRIRFINS